MTTVQSKTRAQKAKERRATINTVVDNSVFALSGLAALWLAWLVLTESLTVGWYLIPFFVAFWALLAYLVLPRVHRILTSIYVPDYFIGRARTSDGLLGDPINLAAEGSEAQLHSAMTRSGWIRADEVTLKSSWRIATSTVFKKSYDEAPVSPLLLFGRQQDLAYQQEVEGNPSKRHHVRFWHSPDGWLLPGGHKTDWLAAGTFDRAVGFSLFTLQITHKIDADTDVERDHIVQSLSSKDPAVKVRTIEDFSTGYHSRNGGGDSIKTDGNLPVISVADVSTQGVVIAKDWKQRIADRTKARPISLTMGALLMVIRVIAGLVTVALVVFNHKDIVDGAMVGLEPSDHPIIEGAVYVILGLLSIGMLVYLFFAWKVYKGSNRARIAAMAYSGALIILAAVDYFSGTKVTLRENIFGLPLDILVLLALSARNSSLWSRMMSPRKTRGEDTEDTDSEVQDSTAASA